ncbi:DUF4976 domain-containing protein [Prolixibacteraceae bacterium Z1-6]|uniref:DUF4976 domain-containing protein n=1 Tax=Draconibacterium aestuarii TaxID=2998507 RepID=A0A9X3FDJ5_9BACT|nr:DUF4976 domain-containing protein [Prolixibacteraceae bacterium Z1-6]
MNFIQNIYLLLLVVLLITCSVEMKKSEAELFHYPIPFYQQQEGSKNGGFTGIKTERFTLITNNEGPWILYDRLIDPDQVNNLAGLDEYIFIQLDLQRQLNDLIRKNEPLWFIQNYSFYDAKYPD